MTPSSEDVGTYNMLSMKLQRDVNCLVDPDRNVRRRAADKLHRTLQSEASRVTDAVLRTLCASNLLHPLLQCAKNDTVENCREKALNSLLFLCECGALDLSHETLKELVALANARLGKLPYPEPTEEIRLLILQLLHAFLKQFSTVKDTSTSLRDVITGLANVLGKMAVDPFPEARKMSAACVILISSYWKNDVGMQIGSILRPLVVNLGHQHSRVRVSALQALEAVVPCSSEGLPEIMKEVLLPAVSKVMIDHAPSVRKQLVTTLATWLTQIEQIQLFEASVFPILLAGAVDEAPEVRTLFFAKLNDLSIIWETRDEVLNVELDNMEMMEVDSESIKNTTPLYFETRPPFGVRKLAARIQDQVLPSLLEKTEDWSVQIRERYTKILTAYLILLEQNMNPYLDKVFAALSKICRDDEAVVFTSLKVCLGVVGFYADPQIILASLLPMAAGRIAGQDTAQHRTNALILLSMSVEGMTAKAIAAHLEKLILFIVVRIAQRITESLSDAAMRESEVSELQDRLAGVVMIVIRTAGPMLSQKDDCCFRLFWILNSLLAMASESSLASETANEGMKELAARLQKPIETLYTRYMGKLLDTMTLPTDVASSWNKNNPSRVLFDSLCRHGGVTCGENMDRIMPVIFLHLDPAQDADVRLAFLALLETMLGMDSISQAIRPFNVRLLQFAIIPNIVWRGGRVAASIRKVAVACAYTCLRQGIADQSCLFETAPQMLSVLKSSMDDDDAKTRQLVCLALQYLFVALPGCLGEEPVNQLYSEILKRLDDSNNTVRKAACHTFTTLLRVAPKEYFQGTIIDYTLDCLFVHLDDSEPEIQEAVHNVIKETVVIDAPLLAKKAEENRDRHQSPRYCDQLLALSTAQLA